MNEKILIVEDEKDIIKVLEFALRKQGFKTFSATNAADAFNLIREQELDLIILDIGLPGKSGLEICEDLRKEEKTAFIPVIMLTAKSKEKDKITGLESGADDYITKPWGDLELIARIKALLRRAEMRSVPLKRLEVGDLVIDLSKIQVSLKGEAVELTPKEFELLKALVRARGRVLSRDYLLNTIWGYDRSTEIQTRTVDVQIGSLRKKLKGEADRLITVTNFGYRFDIDDK